MFSDLAAAEERMPEQASRCDNAGRILSHLAKTDLPCCEPAVLQAEGEVDQSTILKPGK